MAAYRYKAIVNFVVWIGTLSFLLFSLPQSKLAQAIANVQALLDPVTVLIRLAMAIAVAILVAGIAWLFKASTGEKLAAGFLSECSSLCMTLGTLSVGAPFLIVAVSDVKTIEMIVATFAAFIAIAVPLYGASALFAWMTAKIEAKIATAPAIASSINHQPPFVASQASLATVASESTSMTDLDASLSSDQNGSPLDVEGAGNPPGEAAERDVEKS